MALVAEQNLGPSLKRALAQLLSSALSVVEKVANEVDQVEKHGHSPNGVRSTAKGEKGLSQEVPAVLSLHDRCVPSKLADLVSVEGAWEALVELVQSMVH